MLSAILNALITTASKDAIAGVAKKRISKTKMGTQVAGIAGAYALLPLALNGDETAIGALVVMVIGWVMALWGRWKADQPD